MLPLLSVRDLTIEFKTLEGRIRAVTDLSFDVHAGRTLALIGESGSGKSVTGQAILGLLPKTAWRLGGHITFRDRGSEPVDLAALPSGSPRFADIRGDRIAMVMQEPTASLSPFHTVGNQISEALRRHRDVSKEEARQAAEDMLARVGFRDPARAFDAYAFELSGGLCQRAMIAMAMICRPALIIADEPTTALDVTVQAGILKLFNDLQAEAGTAILLIAHDLGVVANMADDILVMHHGETMERGPARVILARPRHPYLKALLTSVPRFSMGPGERLRPVREITVDPASVGSRRTSDENAVALGAPLLTAHGIEKSFVNRSQQRWLGRSTGVSVPVVRDVSLKIRRGECLGLVGESGSGKTTLAKILAGALPPDGGRVEMAGEAGPVDVLSLTGPDLLRFRRRVQYVFQNPYSAFNPRMTVESIIAEPLVVHGVGTGKQQRERVRELLALVGLQPEHANRHPSAFSGGQRQRIGIARALALEPDLILFDEPVSALDVSIQAQILNLLKDLKAALGLTYLFVSHNLAVVDYLSDRIAVMAAGRLVEIAPRERLFRLPVHPYTKTLIAAVPEPDPNQPLDFSLFAGRMISDPASWAFPFAPNEHDGEPPLVEVEPGHFVRMFKTAVAHVA